MPIYHYVCAECGEARNEHRKIADRHDGPLCHGKMDLRIMPAAFRPPQWNMSYYCQGLGKPITSERQRQYEMDKAGVVDYREFRDEPNLPPPAKKQEIPADLKDAMKREGLGDMLPS